MAVTVDVDRIGAVGAGQLQPRAFLEQLDRPAAAAAIAVELGLADTAGNVDLGQSVTIAIKAGHATTDLELEVAVEPALQSGAVGLLDETRQRRITRQALARDVAMVASTSVARAPARLYRCAVASDANPGAAFLRREQGIDDPHVGHCVVNAPGQRRLCADGPCECVALQTVLVAGSHGFAADAAAIECRAVVGQHLPMPLPGVALNGIRTSMRLRSPMT